MTVTHVIRTNGSSQTEVPDFSRTEQVIRRAPTLLDSEERFATSLSRLPEGKRLWDDLPFHWEELFLQAAGSADAMMVEVRKEDADGEERLYRLAHPLPEGEESRGTVDIAWNGRVDTLPAEEAFDATEAGNIFWYYYQHDAVPDEYELRLLDY